MSNKDLTEKFVEGTISDAECEALFAELNHNSEMTDELQQNLYMDELLEQSLVEEKSADNFLANLTERLKEENRQKKIRTGSFSKASTGKFNKASTGKFNRLSSGTYKKPNMKKKKRNSQAPILIFSAIAACVAVGFTILLVNNKENSPSVASTNINSNLYVQDIKGTVSVKRNGKLTNLKDGDFIFKGDQLSSADNGTASLYFISEKTKISLKSGSRFSIDSDISKSEANKVFNVQQGRVYFDVAHQQDGFHFSIKSSKANSRIIGTRLEVNTLSDSTTVKVFEGLVRVKSKLSGDIIDVPGNHYVNIMDDTFPNLRSISGKAPKVTSFSLVNAETDKLVEGFEILKDGIILDQTQIPQKLSIRINASNNERIHGVRTQLKDSNGKIIDFNMTNFEKILPYTMTGDKIAGDYQAWEPKPGEYILQVDVIDIKKKKTDSASLTFTIR